MQYDMIPYIPEKKRDTKLKTNTELSLLAVNRFLNFKNRATNRIELCCMINFNQDIGTYHTQQALSRSGREHSVSCIHVDKHATTVAKNCAGSIFHDHAQYCNLCNNMRSLAILNEMVKSTTRCILTLTGTPLNFFEYDMRSVSSCSRMPVPTS